MSFDRVYAIKSFQVHGSIQGAGVKMRRASQKDMSDRGERIPEERISRSSKTSGMVAFHRLGGDERLLLMLGSHNRLLGDLELVPRSRGEVGILEVALGRLGLGGAGATDQGLGLGGIVTHVLLGEQSGLLGVLLGDGAQLGGLVVDHIVGLLEVVVDELLVGGVDQRNGEGESGAEQCETPVGNDLDEVVREEGTDSSLDGIV